MTVVRDNYRPVSLLNCVSKLFERAVFKYVFNFLRDTNAISLKQWFHARGFHNLSIGSLVPHFLLKHLTSVDNQKDVRVVLCDTYYISKPFDRVLHTGLLAELNQVGIAGNLLQWFLKLL